MKDMLPAVERILSGIQNNEAMAVYGDYDVDGVTSTALLVTALQAIGAQVKAYIPNRFDEGYGLNIEALSQLKEEGVALVISVDCGIRSPLEAEHARSIGLDLIITDHHEPAGDIPRALAVLNPKQPSDNYPEKYLAGVGIAYKLAQALFEKKTPEGFTIESLLDLVALGTVADLAPLNGENRMLVRGGLRQMRASQRQGLLSLAGVADISLAKATAMDIGFKLGPRLNASGRLESALASYQLLVTKDVFEAGSLAQQLDIQNRERQRLTKDIQAKAEVLAMGDLEQAPLILFAVANEFNAGVVGLAASRLTEAYYRPSIVGHSDEEFTRCSCRSIKEFHITKALDECADLFERHGGHAAAAGFTIRNEKVPELKTRLLAIAERELADKDLRHTYVADAVVRLNELNFDLLKYLDYLEPTGYGNPSTLFMATGIKVSSCRTVGSEAKHLKLIVNDGRESMDCIGFGLGEWNQTLKSGSFIDLLFTFETNEFNGRTTLQLRIKDLRLAETSA